MIHNNSDQVVSRQQFLSKSKLFFRPATYVSSLISPILTSQTFRIQICGAIEQLSPMVLWDMLYLKMSRFLSLVYKQEIFDYFMWMSLHGICHDLSWQRQIDSWQICHGKLMVTNGDNVYQVNFGQNWPRIRIFGQKWRFWKEISSILPKFWKLD